MTAIHRRRFLGAAAVIALVPGVGWATAETPGGSPVPDLDGELVLDDPADEDYGQIVHNRARAVLRPGSVRDIQKIIRYANQHRLTVAARGQAHSTFGQAQAPGGIVIDSGTLARVHSVTADRAVVDMGVTWRDLLLRTLESGVASPVATDYLGLSVGGVLSVGGIGGATQHHGLNVDNVLDLDVVTGTGDLVRCAPGHPLFDLVLGGLGQFGVIVRATVRLTPAATRARVYRLSYPDLRTFLGAQRIALADRRFSYLEGQAVPVGDEWGYVLEAAAYYTDRAPDDAALLAGLPEPASSDITEHTYFDWLDRITALVDQLLPLKLPNPWIDLFLPEHATERYVADLLSRLTPAVVGQSPVLIYPVPRPSRVVAPTSEVVHLLAILRSIPSRDPQEVQSAIAANRAAYDAARSVGGTRYSVGAIPFTWRDWAVHYGPRYPGLRRAKSRYDPNGVLTPGQWVFPKPGAR